IHDVVRRSFRPAGPRPRVLDLGCGPGNLLDLLDGHGDLFGSDYSADALRFCAERGYRRLFRADFQRLPVRSESVDLVTCIDVLEHLEDDRRALAELTRVLKPSGLLVASVPAFMSLWGDHDRLYGHHRRYRTREVRERAEEAGLVVRKLSYFEPLFFAPLWLYRRLKGAVVKRGELSERDDFIRLPRPVNAVLTELIAAERFPLRHLSFPFGVTILAVCEKPAR
ncbi:MAG TPA: methyltransferase domain-containing protein, partial [Vicinamibacteria bacterium]|nr:methyltransferase domain-containing protein [Vicinamibacteria bacterium]